MSATEKLIRDSVVTPHSASKLASALAPRNLVKLSVDVFCAQNDYPNKYQAKGTSSNLSLTVSCLYPTAHQKAAAASCTTFFCLCKSVKDHALYAPSQKKWPKADAKVQQILKLRKLFDNFFSEEYNFFEFVYKIGLYTLYKYINGAEFLKFRTIMQ